MDAGVQLCLDVIRHQIILLLISAEEDQEQAIELSEIRDQLDELLYFLVMF